MDPFDGFEFKPLTDGLGFHKKQKSLRESVQEVKLDEVAKPSIPTSIPYEASAGVSSAGAGEALPMPPKKLTFEDIVTSLEKAPLQTPLDAPAKKEMEFKAPLSRQNKQPEFQLMEMDMELPVVPSSKGKGPATPVRSPFPTPEDYKKPFTPEVKKTPSQKDLSSVGTRRGAADSPPARLVTSPGSLSAAILDVVVVMALGLIFTVALLMVTGVELQTLINSANSDLMTQISVGVLLVAVMQIYFIISRAFFGRTLGEWTFDLQLGREEEYKSENYPLRVILRSLLVTVTGVFVLPVLSFLFRRDLAGMITGLHLYAQKQQ